MAWRRLGLALKTTLVEPHGGRIPVESQDGEGKNAFDFSVPLEIAASGKRSTETGEEW